MSPAGLALLETMRQHAGFQELLRQVPAPVVPRFKRSKAGADGQDEAWIYESGKADQHDAWLRFLTGDPDANLTENGERNNG